MKRALRTLIFASLLAVTSTPAWAAGLRDVIEALEAPFRAEAPEGKRINDYTADFFQESRIASLDRLQRARGEVKVRFEAQGRDRVPVVMFHWEYQEPTRQELISDGKTLWVYLPENNQVIQSDIGLVSQARDNDPMTFLTGLGQLSRDFQINFASPNRDVAGNYVLDLRPRRTTALINRMVIVVDRNVVDQALPEESKSEIEKKWAQLTPPKTELGAFGSQRGRNVFPMLSTTVYDPNGNSTIIEFSDVRVNVGLSPGTFRFMLPAGVEVVRPTGKEMGF